MRHITLASETDFEGWRDAARSLIIADVKPQDVTWSVARDTNRLLAASSRRPLKPTREDAFSVPRAFIDLARSAILHSDPERFALLYRLLWRLHRSHDLLSSAVDSDVFRVSAMAMEARLKHGTTRQPMPMNYWGNLPEAPLIKPSIKPREPGEMAAHAQGHSTKGGAAPRRAKHKLKLMAPKKEETGDLFTSGTSLAAVRAEALHCHACPLYKDATQTVFGEGPQHADVMFVGEQPGDKEDLAGKPFVGPAGAMLDKALHEAGVDRFKTYVTNAVKHFKFIPRGKIRLHQKPNSMEIKACRQWFEREKAIIKPKLIVALGATATQCVFQRATPIGKNRGHLIDYDENTKVLVTVHPSYLLRVLDPDREAEYKKFVADLKLVTRFLSARKRAA
jgi:DNA polymerase